MLQNAYFLAKIGADTAENEQHFAEILPIGRRRPPGLLRAEPRRGHQHRAERDAAIRGRATGESAELCTFWSPGEGRALVVCPDLGRFVLG